MAFLSDITLGRYIATESVVHRLDPRTKLLATLMVMSSVIIGNRFEPLYLFSVFLGSVVLLSRLYVRLVLKNIRPFLWLFAFTFLLHAFLTPGRTWYVSPGGWVTLTREGVEKGLFFSFRLSVLVVAASLMTLTTSPLDLADGLERLLRPFQRLGLPTHELAIMVSIALRFIPTLIEEADRLRKAQLARGADFGGNLLRRVRSLIPLLVPLFLSAFRRADQLAVAMEARGYRGGQGRTHFIELKFKRSDYVALAVTLSVCLTALFTPTLVDMP